MRKPTRKQHASELKALVELCRPLARGSSPAIPPPLPLDVRPTTVMSPISKMIRESLTDLGMRRTCHGAALDPRDLGVDDAQIEAVLGPRRR